MKYWKKQQGFTIVEVLITVVVAAFFIAGIYNIYVAQIQISGSAVSFSNADRLAYNNLRTYANGKPPTWFTCQYNNGVPQQVTLLSSSSPVSGITSPVSQTVTADAPFGCGGGSTGMGYPIRVKSTVTFGPGRSVFHATYAAY